MDITDLSPEQILFENLTDLSGYLSSQYKKLNDMSKSMKVYKDKLDLVGFSGLHVYESDMALKFIKKAEDNKKIQTYIGEITKANVDKQNTSHKVLESLLISIWKYHSLLIEIFTGLRSIYNIFTNNQVDISGISSSSSVSSVSQKSLIDTAEMFEAIQSVFNLIIKEHESEELQNILSNIIIYILQQQKDDYYGKFIDKLNELYQNDLVSSIGIYTVQLYTVTVDKIVKLKGLDREFVKKITNNIESLKTEILVSDRKVETNNRTNNTIQELVQMHNLVPTSRSKDLKMLLDEITGVSVKGLDKKLSTSDKYDKNLSSALDGVCSQISEKNGKKFGFIVIFKIKDNPTENSVWGLIDPNYIKDNKMEDKAGSGVNLNNLEKTNTIITLESNKIRNKSRILVCDKSLQKEGENSYYYVIETLDGANFRCLIPWFHSHTSTYYVPSQWFANINNIKYNPSRRLQGYNDRINDSIMFHLSKPYTEREKKSREEVKKAEIQWSNVREKIGKRMVEDFEKLLESNYDFSENSVKINAYDVARLMRKSNIYVNALQYISKLIGSEFAKTSSSLKNIPDETMQTFYDELYLSASDDIRYMKDNITREVMDTFSKDYHGKTAEILSKSISRQTKNKISDIFYNILSEVLKKYISKDNSVYLTIQNKAELLFNTLISLEKTSSEFEMSE